MAVVNPEKVLKEVAGQVAACKNCQLSYSRKKAVPGEGPATAQIMLIGEGPGFYENEQGRPFVGASGDFLNELLAKAGVSRNDVFITNVVKCRPPGNRDPQPDELTACNNYLEKQIEAVNPLVIVTLGRYSMAKFLPNVKISEVHGNPAWVRGRLIIPMFHPAAALHQPSLKTSVERDFARLPEWIQQARLAPASRTAYQIAEQGVGEKYAAQEAPAVQAVQQSLLGESMFEAAAGLPGEETKPDAKDNAPGNENPTQLSLF